MLLFTRLATPKQPKRRSRGGTSNQEHLSAPFPHGAVVEIPRRPRSANQTRPTIGCAQWYVLCPCYRRVHLLSGRPTSDFMKQGKGSSGATRDPTMEYCRYPAGPRTHKEYRRRNAMKDGQSAAAAPSTVPSAPTKPSNLASVGGASRRYPGALPVCS